MSFKEEQLQVTQKKNTGAASNQSTNFGTQFFYLQGRFAVDAYDLEVTTEPQKYADYMELPQDYWWTHQDSPELNDLAQLACSYLSIQATSM